MERGLKLFVSRPFHIFRRYHLKKFALGFLAVFVVSLALAAGETMTLKGDIIDNMCADGHKDELAEFVKTHTKECALMPACAASGYSLYAGGKLHRFDAAGNAKIEEFLKTENSKLQVAVTVKKVGEELSLVSIANQE